MAAPESLRMRIMKNTAPTGAVGCAINRAQKAILEILVEWMAPRRRKRKSQILPVERLLVGRKILC